MKIFKHAFQEIVKTKCDDVVTKKWFAMSRTKLVVYCIELDVELQGNLSNPNYLNRRHLFDSDALYGCFSIK